MLDRLPILNSEVYILSTHSHPPTPSPPPSPPESNSPWLEHQPLTPSDLAPINSSTRTFDFATLILANQALVLSHLRNFYLHHSSTRSSFIHALDLLTHAIQSHGARIHLSGIGKSALIARKVVATLNSLALPSYYLHPVEALHGDIGQIRPHDILILLTHSGNTPEILELLNHLAPTQDVVVLSKAEDPNECEVVRRWPSAVLLPTPVLEGQSEKDVFGVAAPTTSTMCALAVGDALALCLAREVHGWGGEVGQVFEKCHPGGAIGAATRKCEDIATGNSRRKRRRCVVRPTMKVQEKGRTSGILTPQMRLDVGSANYSGMNGRESETLFVTERTTAEELLVHAYAAGAVPVTCELWDGRIVEVRPERIRGLRAEDLGSLIIDVPELLDESFVVGA